MTHKILTAVLAFGLFFAATARHQSNADVVGGQFQCFHNKEVRDCQFTGTDQAMKTFCEAFTYDKYVWNAGGGPYINPVAAPAGNCEVHVFGNKKCDVRVHETATACIWDQDLQGYYINIGE